MFPADKMPTSHHSTGRQRPRILNGVAVSPVFCDVPLRVVARPMSHAEPSDVPIAEVLIGMKFGSFQIHPVREQADDSFPIRSLDVFPFTNIIEATIK